MSISFTFFERFLHRFHLLPTPILDVFGNVLFGRALAISVRRGVFKALACSERTSPEIAADIHLSMEGTKLLLDSLAAAGYVRSQTGRYSLTPESHKWLLEDSPHYLGNLIRYFEMLHARWSYLEHSLEYGAPPHRYFDDFTEEDWRVYVYGMRDLARLLLREVMNKIIMKGSPQSLLDLGGSHGLYAIELCRRHPTLSATIIDFAEALTHTEKIVAEEGMTSRVHLCAADFTHIDLPRTQDCVLMFNIIHGFSDAENRNLVQRALGTLKPDGKLYILDQFREEKRQSGLSKFMPLMVGLNLLNEIGGNTYSYRRVQSWCTGVRDIRRLRLILPGVSLVEAVR